MSERIINLLTLGGRHTRSIALDRDLHDDSIVDGYLITPNALGALKQIGENLAKGSAQRAWKIVGPYGSGKSALGVMLAQLMSGTKALSCCEGADCRRTEDRRTISGIQSPPAGCSRFSGFFRDCTCDDDRQPYGRLGKDKGNVAVVEPTGPEPSNLRQQAYQCCDWPASR